MGCTCSKPFYLEGACKARLELTNEFNVEFKDEVEQEEFVDLCDVSHSTNVGKILDISIKNLTFWGLPHELRDLYIGNFYFG
jgi:hypothetical protein